MPEGPLICHTARKVQISVSSTEVTLSSLNPVSWRYRQDPQSFKISFSLKVKKTKCKREDRTGSGFGCEPGQWAAAKPLQSCATLCDPLVGSPPGSPVPGILQARTLEWVAISFSNA